MPTLYNCKHSGDQYRITKFTSDFEVETSYLCDLHSCECPAGHRPKCRHREMLPKFIAREAVDTQWFFDFDRGGWVQGWKEEPPPKTSTSATIILAHEESVVQQEIAEGLSLLDSLVSAVLPIQPEPTAEQKANMAFTLAGGTITTHYMTDGSINTFKTIDHEPIQPQLEPSPLFQLGGFPDHCLSSGECTTPDNCTLNGCAHGHGTPPREPSPSSPLPSPTIRRRI